MRGQMTSRSPDFLNDHLLVNPNAAGAPTLYDLPPISPPRVLESRMDVQDNGEPLERIPPSIQQVPVYFRRGLPGSSETMYARVQVVRLLEEAVANLPEEFGLVVLDAWRSPELQKVLHNHHYASGSQLREGYVADPKSTKWIPPHQTGGAIDVTLSWRGVPLALGTDFDSFEAAARIDSLERDKAREPDRSLRRLLVHVLIDAGFCPYLQEWWHFSHGDQIWAINLGLPRAKYDRTGPPPDFIQSSRGVT
jgi:D-alanyl-D-alanine dipeptidase